MGIPRHLLPQIPGEQMDRFIAFLRSNDVPVSLVRVPVSSLKPIQSEVNRKKVDALKNDESKLADPIVISKGGFVLDGHHRWLAAKELDPNSKILSYRCNCSIKELVELGHQFDGSFTKTVYENTTIYSDEKDYEPEMHNPDDSDELMVRKTLRPAI